jgi:hypothetical protein
MSRKIETRRSPSASTFRQTTLHPKTDPSSGSIFSDRALNDIGFKNYEHELLKVGQPSEIMAFLIM